MNPSDPGTACFVTTSRDHPIQLWDAFTGKVWISSLSPPPTLIPSISLSLFPLTINNNLFYPGTSRDHPIQLWDIFTGSPLPLSSLLSFSRLSLSLFPLKGREMEDNKEKASRSSYPVQGCVTHTLVLSSILLLLFPPSSLSSGKIRTIRIKKERRERKRKRKRKKERRKEGEGREGFLRRF
jgi:WD40 repeat protein